MMIYEYEYPRPAVSVDILVHRKNGAMRELLLIERKNGPFKGCWALPGGFVDENETLEAAAVRELQEETGLTAHSLRQLKAYSAPDRDPRTRVISVAFVAEANESETAIAADDAADVGWFQTGTLPTLAFDHAAIVRDALVMFELA